MLKTNNKRTSYCNLFIYFFANLYPAFTIVKIRLWFITEL